MDSDRRRRMQAIREQEQKHKDKQGQTMASLLGACTMLAMTVAVAVGGFLGSTEESQSEAATDASCMEAVPGRPLAVAASFPVADSDDERDDETATQSGCEASMAWPVAKPEILSAFTAPAHDYGPGHRGIDLEASVGDVLTAPADGVISFAGRVAGKRVVSIRHGDFILTLEPAATTLVRGAPVRRGEPFATVSRGSDHCDDGCVHWGVRRAHNDYLDPALQVQRRRIVLKPL